MHFMFGISCCISFVGFVKRLVAFVLGAYKYILLLLLLFTKDKESFGRSLGQLDQKNLYP